MSVQDRGSRTIHLDARVGHTMHWFGALARSADSYGLILGLIFLDYVAASVIADTPWGRVIIVLLLGATLLLTLHTSRARRGLILLAGLFVVLNSALAVIGALAPQRGPSTVLAPSIGGFLLIIAPIVILRRIATHTVVTVETILGAIDVYLLLGMIFALLFGGAAVISPAPFFAGVSQPSGNDFLFFSYTTLTTVGYGNLVPAGNLGRTLAMVEALLGQIYLVIVVSRLVSLWGQTRPRVEPPSSKRTEL